MNHKDLLIEAAKVIGVSSLWVDEGKWNPIYDLAQRWNLCERCGLTINFRYGWVANEYLDEYLDFTPNDDESQAIAVLKAAVASKGE